MISNGIAIDPSTNKYDFNYVTCFEKPLGLTLSSFGESYQRLFLLYLKLFQTYRTRTFGKQELYLYDFRKVVKWIVENQLKLKLTIQKPENDEIYDIIQRELDQHRAVLVTVNLKELYYSRHYKLNH